MHVENDELNKCNEKIKKLEDELTHGIIHNMPAIEQLYEINIKKIKCIDKEIQKALDYLYSGLQN